MHLGTVKSINHGRGFAFVTPDQRELGRPDVFMHVRGLVGGSAAFTNLQIGDRVKFELADSDQHPGRPHVVNATVL